MAARRGGLRWGGCCGSVVVNEIGGGVGVILDGSLVEEA